MDSRRTFFGRLAAFSAAVLGTHKLLALQPERDADMSPQIAPPPRPGNHMHDDIFYFYGTGSNDGYPKEDHVLVTDPFEKHVTRTMGALKKSLESAGCSMDSILQLQIFLCLPLADAVAMPVGKARFDAHKAQYDALNRIYGTFFSPGKAPSRACMAVEWIPGDSLIEIVGSALVLS